MGSCTQINIKQLKDFRSLSKAEKEELYSASEVLTVSRGEVIFKENQPLNKLYCIQKGACKFSKLDRVGQEYVLRFLGQGEVMGKRSVWSNKGARVSAVALTDMKLCCFDKTLVLKNLKSNPEFFQDFLDALIEDANINEDTRIVFCVRKGIKQRLARLLLYLAEKYGLDDNGNLNIVPKREDMGLVLGTSAEYVINLLKLFKDKGYIDTNKRKVFIKSAPKLEAMANT